MSRRAFDLYVTESCAYEIGYKAGLWAVRAYYLTRYAVRDWTRRWR